MELLIPADTGAHLEDRNWSCDIDTLPAPSLARLILLRCPLPPLSSRNGLLLVRVQHFANQTVDFPSPL